MSEENLKEVEKLQVRPFTKFCMSIGAVPSSYLAGLTIEEQLLWLCSYLENEVIPTVNNNGEAVEELQGLYEQLHVYVEHYFDNLDVQEEINNKLDEMTTSGQLTYIIKNYVDSVLDPYTEDLTEDINDFKESVNNQLTQTNANVTTNTNDISTLSSRMDTFANLQQGSTTGDAELIDGRISYSGLTYPNIGDSIRGQVDLLFNEIKNQNTEIEENHFDGIYQQGLYKNSDGTYDGTRNDYISNKNKIYVGNSPKLQILNIPALITACYVGFFQEDDTFISAITYQINTNPVNTIPANTSYIRVSMTKGSGAQTKPTDFLPFVVRFNFFENKTIDILQDSLNLNGIQLYNFSNNIYYTADGAIGKVNNRIGLTYQIQTTQDIEISIDNGYEYNCITFSQFDGVPVKSHQISSSGWITTTTTLQKGTVFIVNIRKPDDSQITPDEKIHFHVNKKISYPDVPLGNNYSIDSVYNKNNISLTLLGQVTGWQSFCKYNNSIYCTDGSHIYVYNSSLVLQNTVDINVGHGNSMQLGHNGLCYISGWNDNKIYVVNLATISLVNTINLPTTGYTTGVVDDINNIAYILQRDTNPGDSQTNYNFITYDISNNNIISNKKLTFSFGALQSCDFLDNKIFITYGFGTTEIPSGFKIIDINGSMLGEYILGDYSTIEPEGVYIDRETKEISLMLGNTIYQMS